MNYITELINYTPNNEQEFQDKILFLESLLKYPDILNRENKLAHFTASAFIVNQTHTKVLFVYHNIFNSWAGVGGHADGDDDLLFVALKETQEETGLHKEDIKILSKSFICIDSLPIFAHMRKNKYVNAHTHFNVTYLFEANENLPIRNSPSENSNIAWLPIDKLSNYCSEQHMLPVYEKCIKIIKSLN